MPRRLRYARPAGVRDSQCASSSGVAPFTARRAKSSCMICCRMAWSQDETNFSGLWAYEIATPCLPYAF